MIGVSSQVSERENDEPVQAPEPRPDVVIEELRHRIANIFTVIRSVIGLTAQHYDDVQLYRETLIDRLRALEETHNLLVREPSERASIEELIRLELAPYDTGAKVSLAGPAVPLYGGAAESFAMIVHELVTNSVKHGALGEPSGKITIRWTEKGANHASREVAFEWQETMKRRLGVIDRYGYGASIIGLRGTPLIGHSASLEPTDSGLRYRLTIPYDRLTKFAIGTGGADSTGAD